MKRPLSVITNFACLRINYTDVQNYFSLKLEKWFCLDMAETLMLLTVYSYNVTYAFQSESTLYICLNDEVDQFRQMVECSFTN